MILHTINKSPFGHRSYRQCLAALTAKDGILLIEDGTYALLDGEHCQHFNQALAESTIALYVLAEDAQARGITITSPFEQGVTPIDMNGFVQLCGDYDSVCSWYR